MNTKTIQKHLNKIGKIGKTHFDKNKSLLQTNIKHLNKNTKIIIGVSTAIILLIAINSIISANRKDTPIQKIDFYTQTKTPQDFSNGIQINKPGKIIGNEEIIITSQVMGSIKKIYSKEGQEIGQNKKLIDIKDSVANYGLMVQKAKNALNAARLQYTQNKTQIEQGITNSQLNIEKLQNSLSSIQSIGEQNIRGAENNLNNSNTQKNNLILQMISEKNKLETLLSDILHKNDTILGVTTKYKTANDTFEIYLSAKNSSYKLSAKRQLLELYKQRDKLKNLNTSNNISNTELKNNVLQMDKIYSDIDTFLNTMENIFINSVSSTTFPQSKIDGLIAINNQTQAAAQQNFGFFTQFKQQIDSALIPKGDGYIIAGSESADIGYQNTITSTQQQISDIQIGIKTAQENYQSALKTKDSSLGLASTNIEMANLAYQEALKQYAKLNVKAPITGTIGKILVDKGQEIRVGTPLLTIINNSDPIVKVGITALEYQKINSGSVVTINYMGKILSGDIISISAQAGGNGLYSAIIQLKEKVDIIGDTAIINISTNTDKFTLPLNIIHPLDGNNGYIYILSGGKPDILNIKIGEIRGENIEVISEIPQDTQIITNDISNYNPMIHNLIIK